MAKRLDHTKGGQYESDPARVQRDDSDFRVPFGWKRKLTPAQKARAESAKKSAIAAEKQRAHRAHNAQERAKARKKAAWQSKLHRAANRQKHEAERKSKIEAKAEARRNKSTDQKTFQERLRAAAARASAKAAAKAALHKKYQAIARRRDAEVAMKKKSHLQAWAEEQGILKTDRDSLRDLWRSAYLSKKGSE